MKGGSGKTTLASCLAGHWSKIGKRVSYIDGDPSQTAWRLSRLGHRFHQVEFETADQNTLGAKLKAHKKAETDRLLIDTPGFDSPLIEIAVKNSDCILIPIRPSPIDFQVAIDIFNMIAELSQDQPTKMVRFVLSQANMKSLIARQIKRDIENCNFLMCNQHLSVRVAYAESILAGSTPSYLQPHGAAAKEIAALAIEIDNLLNNSSTNIE